MQPLKEKIPSRSTIPLIKRLFAATRSLVRLVYPDYCVGCNSLIEPPEQYPVCRTCQAGIKYCEGSFACVPGEGNVASYFSLGYYEGVLRNLIVNLKYHSKVKLVDFFADKLIERSSLKIFFSPFAEADIIIPVPLHFNKIRQRGFNQAELLGVALSRRTGIPVICDAVSRHKETLPQNRLKIEDRFDNLYGAFSLNDKKGILLRNKNVIIIDDILTTGATIENLARTIRLAGAANIFAVTIAKTLLERVIPQKQNQ